MHATLPATHAAHEGTYPLYQDQPQLTVASARGDMEIKSLNDPVLLELETEFLII